MLLAGAERQPERHAPLRIPGHPHQAAWHLALELVPGGQEPRMGASKAQGHPEALGGAHRHIRPEFPRRAQEREGEQVGGDHAKRPGGMGPGEEP